MKSDEKKPKTYRKKSRGHGRLAAAVAAVALVAAAAAVLMNRPPEKLPAGHSPGPVVPAEAALFPGTESYRFTETPAVPSYRVEPGLRNVLNLNQYRYGTDETGDYYFAEELPAAAYPLLERNGFAILPDSFYPEYYSLYEMNRYSCVPSFITTDSAVHTFHLLYDHVLKEVERSGLLPSLTVLTRSMADAARTELDRCRGTAYETAALRNLAYFTVAGRLLDDGFPVPSPVERPVADELSLIREQREIAPSPVINYGQVFDDKTGPLLVDYSQFRPRGHYTQSESLKRYFAASMWYGQMTFRSRQADEVRSALLMTESLRGSGHFDEWLRLFGTVNFFVGECDDITPVDYLTVLDGLSGGDAADAGAALSEDRFDDVWDAVRALPPPKVNSIPVFGEELQPDRDAAITGFRFLGQRFTIDADIFQRLIDREVKDRFLPAALDIPAAFGSEEALALLRGTCDVDDYPEYGPRLSRVRDRISGIPEETWTSNLYWSWMNMLRPLADNASSDGLPWFMQNTAWVRKELNTFLGSWTELKHDSLLYAKQAMSELGGGGAEALDTTPDDRGYVEPSPEVFRRLAGLVAQTRTGLKNAGYLSDELGQAFDSLFTLADRCGGIAEAELRNAPLTGDDYDFIRLYGAGLEHLWEVSKQDVFQEMRERDGFLEVESYKSLHPDAVIADVVTDPNGQVLEEATGYSNAIVVAFPRDGQVVLGRGLVYSRYEFRAPLDGRMTDEEWHERLLYGEMPGRPVWMEELCASQ